MSYVPITPIINGKEVVLWFERDVDLLTFEHHNASDICYDVFGGERTTLTPFGLQFLRSQIFLYWAYNIKKRNDSIFKIREFDRFVIYVKIKKVMRTSLVRLFTKIKERYAIAA